MEHNEKAELKENQFEQFKESVKQICTMYIEDMARDGLKFLSHNLPTLFEQKPDATLDDAVDACFDENSIDWQSRTAEILITLIIAQMRIVDFSQRGEVVDAYQEALDEIDPNLKDNFFDVDFWISLAANAIETDKFIKDRLNELGGDIKNRTDKIL